MTTHGALGAALFFVSALALVGVPPLSGFFGKLTLIRAAWKRSAFSAWPSRSSWDLAPCSR